MTQPSLNFTVPVRVPFKGATYTEADRPRLERQIDRVLNAIKDGKVHTVEEISATTGDPPTSVSAQVRNLRKGGAHDIELVKLAANGHYGYRLLS